MNRPLLSDGNADDIINDYTADNPSRCYSLYYIQHTYRTYVTPNSTYVFIEVFPHFTCDHVSQQVMITPDNEAYYAQLYAPVTKPALFAQDCQTIDYSSNIHLFAIAISRRLASRPIAQRATAISWRKNDYRYGEINNKCFFHTCSDQILYSEG